MELSREVCERARQSRDARFDGRFFVAVHSTEAMTASRLRRRAEQWRPWRAYAAICLWRRDALMRSDRAQELRAAAQA